MWVFLVVVVVYFVSLLIILLKSVTDYQLSVAKYKVICKSQFTILKVVENWLEFNLLPSERNEVLEEKNNMHFPKSPNIG